MGILSLVYDVYDVYDVYELYELYELKLAQITPISLWHYDTMTYDEEILNIRLHIE